MGLEQVKGEILDQAEKQAQEFLAKAKQEAKVLMQEQETLFAEYNAKEEEKLLALLETLEKRGKASVDLEEKKAVGEKKRKLITGIFDKAKAKIIAMPAQEKKKLYQHLVQKAKRQMDIAVIYCAAKDKAFVKGHKVQQADIAGGLIFENKEGTISLDYSFDTLVQGMQESELQHIAGILFGE